ncbi:MAG: hypothetical protein AAGB22_02865, partial [Bacteroidota bacterium]
MKNTPIWNYRHAILLVATAIGVYANTWSHDYAWDDAIVITANERVLAGWDALPDLFQNVRADSPDGRYGYRPLTLITFATEIELFGRNPRWPHVINTLLYGLVCLVAWLTLLRLFPSQPNALLFWIIMLFTLHPVHTEVVANIKSRDELLAMLFGLLAVIQYHRYLHAVQWRSLLLSLVFLLLGFLSKESAIVFAGVFLLLPWVEASAHKVSRWRGMLPALGAITLVGFTWWLTQQDAVVIDDAASRFDRGLYYESSHLGNPLFFSVDGWWEIPANSLVLSVLYLKKFIFPWPLLHDYSTYQVRVTDWGDPLVYF